MPAEIARIEDKINREVAAGTSVQAGRGMVFANAGEVMEAAKLMAIAQAAIPAYLRGSVGDCFSIMMQSLEWNMSPFAVARKSYKVNDTIAYEAQLIHAVVQSRAPIDGRFRYDFSGDGPSRKVRVWAKLRGSDEIVDYQSPMVSQITVKNSPLWKSDTDQQLSYYGVRALCRRHFPDVLMGVYSIDELAPVSETPRENPLVAREFTGEVIPGEELRDRALSTYPDPTVSEPAKARRKRRTKAEMEAARAAEEEPQWTESGDQGAPPEPRVPRREPVQVDLEEAIAAKDDPGRAALTAYIDGIGKAKDEAELRAVHMSYATLLSEIQQVDPELWDQFMVAFTDRQAEIPYINNPDFAGYPEETDIGPKWDWSADLEKKIQMQSGARPFCERLWAGKDIEDVEAISNSIALSESFAKSGTVTRMVVLQCRQEARARYAKS